MLRQVGTCEVGRPKPREVSARFATSFGRGGSKRPPFFFLARFQPTSARRKGRESVPASFNDRSGIHGNDGFGTCMSRTFMLKAFTSILRFISHYWGEHLEKFLEGVRPVCNSETSVPKSRRTRQTLQRLRISVRDITRFCVR